MTLLEDAIRRMTPEGYELADRWTYRDVVGVFLMEMVRYNATGATGANGATRSKQYRPFISDGNGGFVSKFPDPRPLYNLHKLAANPDAIVVMFEGEKCAEAASAMFTDFVCTTTAGGSNQAKCSDVSALNGRTLYVWPDNNAAGSRYAADVAALLPQAKIVKLPDWIPPDWDLADSLPEGRTIDDIADLLSNAKPYEKAKKNGQEELRDSIRKAVTFSLVSRCAAEIAPEPIQWNWEARIALGKHTCIAGEPGTGKSQISIYIIATVTKCGSWPCGEGEVSVGGSVIILSAEDGEADTIVPRLMAAGADLHKIHIISAVKADDGTGRRNFNLQADLDLLEKKIKEIGDVVLVVIDPISSYLGKTDSHNNADVRGTLEPIGEMAELTRVAIISITHFNKAVAGSTTKALHRFIGSIAFVGAPRMAFAVIEDPEDPSRRLFLHAKNNLAPPPQGLAFRLEQKLIGETGEIGKRMFASYVKWDAEPVDMTADAAMAAGNEGGDGETKLEAAMDFIRQMLTPGSMSQLPNLTGRQRHWAYRSGP